MSAADRYRPTVAVDLDATLATYHGWCGLEAIGDPRPGAVDFLWALYHTHTPVVHTARVSTLDGRDPRYAAEVVTEWLRRHRFPPVTVWDQIGKPMAAFYVDDRAVVIAANPGPADYEIVLATIRGVKHGG